MNIMKKLTLPLILLLTVHTHSWAGLPVSVEGEKLPTLAPMLQQVTPSVVNIATSSMVVQHSPLFNDPFFRHFLMYLNHVVSVKKTD